MRSEGPEDPASPLGIGPPRPGHNAHEADQGDQCVPGAADEAAVDEGLHLPAVGVEPQLIVHNVDAPPRFRFTLHLLCLGGCLGHWLLTEDVPARRERFERSGKVEVGRGGDPHEVEVSTRQGRCVPKRVRNAEPVGHSAGFLEAAARHRDKIHSRVRPKRRDLDLSPESCPHDADPQVGCHSRR